MRYHTMIPIYNYLIISAIGRNRPEVTHELTRACVQCGCNLLNAKVNILGETVAITLFLAGNWGAIAKMEASLPNLAQRLELDIQSRRSHEAGLTGQFMVYSLQLIGIDRVGILNEITDFLQKQSVLIEEISAHHYTTHTNTQMASIHLKINIPNRIHLATFREKFMNYCDDQNFDGFVEPLRNPCTS